MRKIVIGLFLAVAASPAFAQDTQAQYLNQNNSTSPTMVALCPSGSVDGESANCSFVSGGPNTQAQYLNQNNSTSPAFVIVCPDPSNPGYTIACTFSGGGSGSPGGSSGQVQYNESGSFGGISGQTTDGTITTFGSGDLELAGSGSGRVVLNSPASGGGTLTLPAGADTLVGLAAAQTLTNKTISGSSNTLSNIANSSLTNSTITIAGQSTALGNSLAASNMDFSTPPAIGGTTPNAGAFTTLSSTGQSLIEQGSVTAPGEAFIGDTQTGIYRISAGTIGFASVGNVGFSVGGTLRATNSTGGAMLTNGATATAPTYVPNLSDLKAGMGADAGGDVSLIVDNSGSAQELLRLKASHLYAINIGTAAIAETGYLCYNSGSTPANEVLLDTAACLTSLRRFKTIDAPMEGSRELDELMKLKPVWGRWNQKTHPSSDTHEQPFLIAEDVEQVDPRLAAYTANGELKGVRYDTMTAFLVAAIQEQQREIDQLRNQ